MTDGILLAEIQRDRRLLRYDTLILDEAHERSLNIDFLLGYLRELLPRRPDLKVIVTSATIEPRAVRRALPAGWPAPIVEVSGRTYPVEIRYRPLEVPVPDRRRRRSRRSRPRGRAHRAARPDRGDRRRRRANWRPNRPATCWCSCPVSGRSATPPRRCARLLDRTPRCCRCTRGCRPPSSRRCSRRTPAGAAGRAGHQRRRDVADRARHPLRRRPRHRAHLPLQPPHQGAAAADRTDLAGLGRAARRPVRAHRARACASGCTPRRTSTAGRATPTRRSCAPTSPR